uniref:Solute-binding protein family 3/N-terminal domain-containing protein n=1 Tax=Shewanella sp. (strain MR-7) TaxID=60481 RepID=Q0HZ70_SHESR
MHAHSRSQGIMAIFLSMLLGLLFNQLFCLTLSANESPPPRIPTTSDKPIITMAFYEDPKDNLYFRLSELIYTEAFARLGYQFNYLVVPPMRASLMADSGKVDGEPARVFSYGLKFQNLIRVEEPFIESKLMVYGINPNIQVQDWAALLKHPYRIEYYRGIFYIEQKLEGLVPVDRLTTSSSPVNSFRRMSRDRIDIYIDTEAIGEQVLKYAEFQHSKIHPVGKLDDLIGYAYLHKRHQALAQQLSATLKQMKQEGSFEQYWQQAHKELDPAIAQN